RRNQVISSDKICALGTSKSMSKWFLCLFLWCMVAFNLAPERARRETWIISADLQTASVSDRVEQSIWNKLNPLCWFLNDDDPAPHFWQPQGKHSDQRRSCCRLADLRSIAVLRSVRSSPERSGGQCRGVIRASRFSGCAQITYGANCKDVSQDLPEDWPEWINC